MPIITRNKRANLEKDVINNFSELNQRPTSGQGSRIAKRIQGLIVDSAKRDYNTHLVGTHCVETKEVIRPPEIVYKDREVVVSNNGSLLDNAKTIATTALSALGKYFTSSTAIAVGAQAAGYSIHPAFSIFTLPALYGAHQKEFISTETALSVGAGILAGLSDSNNYFEAEDFNARIITMTLGSFLVLAAHLIRSKNQGQ